MKWNKKICIQHIMEMRSPIEEQMGMGGMPPAMMKLMAMPREMKVNVGGNGGQPQAA